MKKINLLICVFFSMLLSVGCKKSESDIVKGCKNRFSFNYNPLATEDDGSCKDMEGCLGYAGNLSNSGTTGNTFYNQYWDQKMSEEIYIQSNFFNGIYANVVVLYEPDPSLKNAYASPDGRIMFGYHMFYYTIQTYGELPVAGILAHEWGHRVQQTVGWGDYYKPQHKELEADAFSGFYMALAKQYAWGQIQSYYANVYALGDYAFNSPTHHGTPDQRLQAAYLGVTTAIDAINSNTQFTYDQLHSIFFQAIKTRIAGKVRSSHFSEVQYPADLTAARVQRLFPKL